jgi:GNAT superfamily N-acetyltransferase
MPENHSGTLCKDTSGLPEIQDCRFLVSGYVESRDEILRLRNANRQIPQNLDYLDWRYQQLQGAPEPVVFWAVSKSGQRVGMASLIFRPYWINGAPKFFAVLGDISLDKALRGIGLGRRLLHFLTNYIDLNFPGIVAFVMPNAAARKSLKAIGWQTVGSLIPHVFLLNPDRKLHKLLKSTWMASRISRLYTRAVFQILSRTIQKECSLQLVDQLDESFEVFWRNFPKGNLVLRDRSVESLTWRFLDHPQNQILIARVNRDRELVGYVAFEIAQGDREVLVHDLIVAKDGDVRSVVALFVLKCLDFENICTIRMVTSDSHPFEKGLSRFGFVRRKSESVFQVHTATDSAVNSCNVWVLTWGDKDI